MTVSRKKHCIVTNVVADPNGSVVNPFEIFT